MTEALWRSVLLSGGVLYLGLAGPVSAATLFDNTANDLSTRFDPGTTEVGDEVLLAGTGNLTCFSFEYWGVNSANPLAFAGSIQADVRMYYNDGALYNGYATPGAKFFDSGWFSVGGPTPRSTFSFTEGSDFAPGGLSITSPDITWSVQFQGMGATDSVGVDIYSPPVVGHDYPDYWDNSAGWTLQTNTVPMDFAALMETPEPSSTALSLFGGLGVLGFMRWVRRRD